jgi:hypothetical protein
MTISKVKHLFMLIYYIGGRVSVAFLLLGVLGTLDKYLLGSIAGIDELFNGESLNLVWISLALVTSTSISYALVSSSMDEETNRPGS